MRTLKSTLVGTGMAATMVLFAAVACADTIAYLVPSGTAGNQAFGGPLGMDFDVNQPIFVTQLGVFDHGSNGLALPLSASLWDRTNTSAPLEVLPFTPGNPGALTGGSRFQPLASRRLLLPGFRGTIVAEGYGSAELNGNSTSPVWTTDSGGGAISFVGGGRYGFTPGQYPTNPDGGPANRYAAGTFAFQPFQIAYQVQGGGTVGNQAWGGPLGMDFVTQRPVKIEYLGVFDSGQDGLNLPITATLFARLDQGTPANFGDDKGVPLATITFSGSDGVVIGGSRFLKLATPLILPGGFAGTIVAKGYGATELNGNGSPTRQTFDGGGALAFVGSSRYGMPADTFPGTPDAGPANRYAAGTFQFEDYTLGGGSTHAVAVPNFSFELPGRSDGGYGNDTTAWNPSAGNNAGDWNPPGGGPFNEPIPDGNHVAFVSAGSLISNPLAETLQADTLYVLEAEWGHRTDSPNPRHAMYLRAGGIRLGYVNNVNIFNGPIPASGMFETACGLFTANHNAPMGSPLDIELQHGGGSQAIFDNVRLTKITGAAVPLFNPSFELDDVPPSNGYQFAPAGWVQSTANTGGVFEGATEIVAADGSQSAFIFGGNSLTQTLSGITLQPNDLYVLLVDVADRMSTTFGGYRVELLVGGQPLAVDDNSLGVVQFTSTPGQFYTTSVLQLRATGFDSYFGQELAIRLTALGSGTQTYFDNVRLFALQVPEPSALALWGLGLFIWCAGAGAWRGVRRSSPSI